MPPEGGKESNMAVCDVIDKEIKEMVKLKKTFDCKGGVKCQ